MQAPSLPACNGAGHHAGPSPQCWHASWGRARRSHVRIEGARGSLCATALIHCTTGIRASYRSPPCFHCCAHRRVRPRTHDGRGRRCAWGPLPPPMAGKPLALHAETAVGGDAHGGLTPPPHGREASRPPCCFACLLRAAHLVADHAAPLLRVPAGSRGGPRTCCIQRKWQDHAGGPTWP